MAWFENEFGLAGLILIEFILGFDSLCQLARYFKSLAAPSSSSSIPGSSRPSAHDADASKGHHDSTKVSFTLEALLDFNQLMKSCEDIQAEEVQGGNHRKRPNYDGSRRKFFAKGRGVPPLVCMTALFGFFFGLLCCNCRFSHTYRLPSCSTLFSNRNWELVTPKSSHFNKGLIINHQRLGYPCFLETPTWACKPAEWQMFVTTIPEGSDSAKRTIAQTWSCGEVSLRKTTLLLQEGLAWRYTWKTSSLPEHLLGHEEKQARPVCLALSLFDLTLPSQETKSNQIFRY